MAEQEIEISNLEFKENLSGDDLIPVENSTKTFATSLTKLKDWLLNYFVSLSGDQLISGFKSFNQSPTMPTPTAGDSSNKGATTEFVRTAVDTNNPNYTGKIVNSGTTYTTQAEGYVSVKVDLGNGQSCSMKINNVEVWYQYIIGDRGASGTFSSGLYKVNSGDVITTTHSSNIIFYPLS